MILYSCSVEYAFNQRIFLGGNDMVSCENMKKGEVYKCQSCGFEIEVKEACDCGTSGNCETHDKNHECCEFTCCGKPLVKVK
ncbi:hypothetical protein HMPREF9094_1821 [Fusobacterium animalis ATCC 51191]|uniref:Uncharacterized protein n=8 Tax=Fusobacterium TaxID=848 RepID=F9EPG6_9FUSO|nr:hypothetical protein HMPREF9094_1821 [Fusobacterium animalis ATCC 51191]